jgi:hypothetical protein
MSDKLLLCDMDGIVANFVGGIERAHGYGDLYEQDPSRRGDAAWDNAQYMDGITMEEYWEPATYDFWRNLDKMPDADKIIGVIDDTIGIEHCCFITSPCLTTGCYEGKRDWVREHYPSIPILFSTSAPGGLPPKYFAASPDRFLIDDHTPNIDGWRNAGGVGYLYPRPWNRHYELFDKEDISENVARLEDHIATFLNPYYMCPETTL